MRRKLPIKTNLRLKPVLCIFKANHFHLIKFIFALWRNIIKWITIENENDDGNNNDIDIDNDDDRKIQDSTPYQQQNQQRASINLAVNTTHAFKAKESRRSSRFQYWSLPGLPSETNDKAVSKPQPIMRWQHQHRLQSVPPFSTSPLPHHSTDFLNTTDDNF